MTQSLSLSVNQMLGARGVKVRYAVPATFDGAQIRLVLFDMRGRLVRTLMDEPQASGDHTSLVDLRNLSAGHYICRMSVRTERLSAAKTVRFTIAQ